MDDDFVACLGDLDRLLAFRAGARLASVLIADIESRVTTGTCDGDRHG